MYASQTSLGVGGHKGKFALYLSENLLKGTSTPVESYNNKVLSKKSNFNVKELELWALTD